MYRVLLVDDEIWCLEGMRKLVDWERLGFTVTAQATDASEAFDLICRTKPDVVFTDIRMPEMSGIELLNKTRQAGIESEIVIVSGFAEFEYAQEALRRGAFDYQLKPVDPEEARLLLQKLKQHLDRKQAESVNIWRELSPVSGNPLEMLKTRGFVPIGDYWRVLMLTGSGSWGSEQFASLFPSLHHHAIPAGDTRTLLLLNGDKPPEDQEIFPILDGWSRKRGVLAGCSGVAAGIEHLGRLIREASMAALQTFLGGKTGAVIFTAAGSAGLENLLRKTEKLLWVNNDAEICSVLSTIPDLFQKENLGIYHAVYLWNRFAILVGRRLKCRSSGAEADFLDYEELVNRFGSLASMCRAMKAVIQKVCSPIEEPARQPAYNDKFIALLEHVNQNYDKELSLSELADKYYLNMSYCSELFRKATGYTFRYYVTKLRMESAAELMKSGKYSVDRVSCMTGYQDYYYFCKTFKKFYGITPYQFTAKSCP
ncbi:response regulator transcription factor [Paenibacillus humicola]|uniref:response regulator transcription factor n=1 Tax=Paenibacillus humicola TaxID=3110540 RepID=UPI00237A0E83|nr:response regulator [Paenibacillus humicola]